MLNFPLGYYTVNDRIFASKLEAVIWATDNGFPDLKWNFNDELFNKLDWTSEPDTSIEEYYKIRAQQIREKYDYVVVMYSGGADSTNILMSFLNNGIHIDEIVVGAPLSGLNNWTYNNKNFDVTNILSETKFAQLEFIEYVHSHWPNVKITINDYFLEMLEWKDGSWINDCFNFINPSVARHSLNKLHHIKDLAEQGKTIAKVYGMDKPILAISETNNIYTVFNDTPLGIMQHASTKERYPNLEPVAFYWSPDLPQLMIKQAHVLSRWIMRPENAQVLKVMWYTTDPLSWQTSERRLSDYHRSIVPCIYPNQSNRNAFQTDKALSNESSFAQDKTWFSDNHSDIQVTQIINDDISNLLKKIDKKYMSPVYNKTLMPHRKYFKIGHVDKFKL